jgi:hypothetical protein
MSNTLFTKVDYSLSSLIDAIAYGQIGLPDIQRPFVWKNVKVRDLFDSMYRGYPIGYLLFWETGVRPGTRQIGTDVKQLVPTRVIVDGQQRLTSLYAVIKGIPVVRSNFTTEKIEIAFNPLDGRFEVPDAAVRRDKRFIPSISAIWDTNGTLIQFAGDYIETLKSQLGGLTPEETSRAQTALGRLHSLLHFPFTAVELSPQVKAEQVSEVFVRINSEGKKLNQSDFILTLMSVFWDEGRTQLEDFSRRTRVPGDGPSPYNHFFQPYPDQLLRVAIGVGFRRARLSAVYSVLRGRDVAKDGDGAANRDEQFELLKKGQAAALKVQYWQDFMLCVVLAGYRSAKIISSENALIFSYVLYLIGRTQINVNEHVLRKTIAQWLFMSSLTGRFTSSPESQMEFDLARLRTVTTPEHFVSVINGICSSTLTSDFWSITLPGDLATSAARSPSMFAFFAALNVLDARALYSAHTVRELMDPATQGTRSSLERHHLFPVAYLKKTGVEEQRDYNQIANYAIVEWGDNGAISDSPPSEYAPTLEKRFDAKTLNTMYRHHALPMGWETMPFDGFLKERRGLIAQTIREGYEKLAGHGQVATSPPQISDIIGSGESDAVEFKSTLRTNLHTGEKDVRMESTVLKTIAGFLNTTGGSLVVGVADDGTPVGLQADGFANEDKMALHLINLLKERMGGQHAINVHPRFDDHAGVRVLVIECDRSKTPVFVKDGAGERFFVRYGPSTQELTGATAQAFMQQRFQ